MPEPGLVSDPLVGIIPVSVLEELGGVWRMLVQGDGEQAVCVSSEAWQLCPPQTADPSPGVRVENLQVLTWTFSQNICSLARCQVLGTSFPDVRDQLGGQQGGMRGLLLRKELIDQPGCCHYPDLCVLSM